MRSIVVFSLLIGLMILAMNAVKADNVYGNSSVLSPQSSSQPVDQKYIDCLNNKGLVFYGTDWCPHCKHQKKLLGEYISQIKYVNCDKNRRLCRDKQISGYPTLLLEREQNREIMAGSIRELASQARCI